MRNLDKEIANAIYQAQWHSDKAKEAQELGDYNLRQDYYHQKDLWIYEALNLICRSKSKLFRFSVQRDLNINSYLVYFTYNDGKNRYQVSFHNFSKSLGRYVNPNQRTHWDHKISRVSAREIYDLVMYA